MRIQYLGAVVHHRDHALQFVGREGGHQFGANRLPLVPAQQYQMVIESADLFFDRQSILKVAEIFDHYGADQLRIADDQIGRQQVVDADEFLVGERLVNVVVDQRHHLAPHEQGAQVAHYGPRGGAGHAICAPVAETFSEQDEGQCQGERDQGTENPHFLLGHQSIRALKIFATITNRTEETHLFHCR